MAPACGDPSAPSSPAGRRRRIAVLGGLVAIGLAAGALLPIEPAEIEARVREYAKAPWFPAVAIGLQAVLFSLALPGSAVLWAVAPFYPPRAATAVLVTGSALGAVGAYVVAARFGRDAGREGWAARIRSALAERGDVMTQMAMRSLPGFPHSVINYAAGALRLPLTGFVLAAVAGLTVKWGVYSAAIYGVVRADSPDDALDAATLGPLIAFAAFLAVSAAARRRLKAPRASEDAGGGEA